VIRRHAFNSAWWDAPVGIVDDPGFFALPPGERAALLSPFAWAEFRASLDAAPLAAIARSGFAFADVQLHFRLALRAEAADPSFTVHFAEEAAFAIAPGEVAPFRHERFAMLAGATAERLEDRYLTWSHSLLASSPGTCLELRHVGEPQGWFLATAEPAGLRLALAMLRRDARISGLHLYRHAVSAFAGRGHHVGFASFSVTNTAVHNLYAALGARFTRPEGCWLWSREGAGG
jgi:hypothetical protein